MILSDPIFPDQLGDVILFEYHWYLDRQEVITALTDFMQSNGYNLTTDYTMNNINRNSIEFSEQVKALRMMKRYVGVWFKNPEDFVMMKIKHG